MQAKHVVGRSIADQTVHLGETVELKCYALEGKTVRWSKDGVVLQTKTAGYGTSLRISSVQQGDEGSRVSRNSLLNTIVYKRTMAEVWAAERKNKTKQKKQTGKEKKKENSCKKEG